MKFEQSKSVEKIGEKIGYIFSYFIFTTILFFILTFLNKLPSSWTYFHIMAVTLLVALIGSTITRFLV